MFDQSGEDSIWIAYFKEDEVGVRWIRCDAFYFGEGLEDAFAFGAYKCDALLYEFFFVEDGHGRCVREDVDVKGDFAFDDFVAQVGMGNEIADADARGAKCF